MPVYKNLRKHKLLLDTHVWIWLMLGDERLNLSFRRAVEQYKEEERILISAISVWELGMLVERERIQLEIDCLDWVEQALSSLNIALIPLTPRIAIGSSRLPEKPHGDPADRILIATAHELNAVLVTHDQKILEYGKSKFIAVYDPCFAV
jgi:PIN domain nuclease of toxin-antitoxin system